MSPERYSQESPVLSETKLVNQPKPICVGVFDNSDTDQVVDKQDLALWLAQNFDEDITPEHLDLKACICPYSGRKLNATQVWVYHHPEFGYLSPHEACL